RHVVGGVFGRAVERPVSIDGGIAPVGRDQVVQIVLVGAPFPRRDDDVAFDALPPRRLALRQVALGDAVGPVPEILERDAAELSGNLVSHLFAGLAGPDAPHPRFRARTELAEGGGNGARRLLAQLMAADAVDVVHLPEPVLASDVLRDISRAAELARWR